MISLDRYRRLLAVPAYRSTLLASVPGRLPISMTALALLLLVRESSGSFAFAGVTSGIYIFGLAVASPVVGRLADRFGPGPVLMVNSAAFPLALALLLLLVAGGAAPLVVAAAAFCAGAVLPPVTVCMRALIPQLVADPSLRQTAYPTDAVIMELQFIAGPAVVAALVGWGHASAAVLVPALAGALGGWAFARSPGVRGWTPHAGERSRRLAGPLHSAGLLSVLAACLCFAFALGLFEVAMTGVAARAGHPAAGGLLMALAAVGSTLGAVVYGSRDWHSPVPRQYVAAFAAMTAGMLVISPVQDLALFALLCVPVSSPIAPLLAAQASMVERVSPPGMLAESYTWVATGILAGVSAGFAVGGWLIEHSDPGFALLLAAGSAAVGGGIAAATLARRVQSG